MCRQRKRERKRVWGMNRKPGKIALYVMAGMVSLSAVFGGLVFMGTIPLLNRAVRTEEAGWEKVPERDGEGMPAQWEIKFKGMKIAMEERGTAYIHESGCLNVSLEDGYLIQIDVESDTVDNMWSRIDKKMEDLEAAGYRIEQDPKRMTEEGSDIVRYVISRENERGTDHKRIYSEVCLVPADTGRHFLAVIRYDGTDVDILDEEAKNELFDKAFADVCTILADAEPTKETDDEYGSYWTVEENINPGDTYSESGTVTYDDGKLTLTHRLPEKCYLVFDDISGKTYFDEENRIYIRTSVVDYTWESAEQMAEKHSTAGFSKIHEQDRIEINGRVFYYYTYSVMEGSKTERKYHYYFHAYCDLDNGDIYTVSGSADDNPLAMDESYYYSVMDICE